ncbi:MAG: hypothetical protein IJI47_02565 [Eubacterium sp.]|nr:hypothetical protein [Eubacterium sp.]MBR0412436.1 hypothetical protein [Eubacterium sp.]
MKKTISLLLAIIMIVSVFGSVNLTAYAATVKSSDILNFSQHVKTVYNAALNRKDVTITVYSKSSAGTDVDYVIYSAATSDDYSTSSKSGYHMHPGGWSSGIGTLKSDKSGYKKFRITYNLKGGYVTTIDMEKELFAAVSKIVSNLDLKSSKVSDYTKIYRIYNFLCSSVKYDYDNYNSSNYGLRCNAYAALVNGTAACGGYADAFNILAKEAGLKSCVIIGPDHAYNIVKLGGKWYNLDATWDSEYFSSGTYHFFLQSNADFTNCKQSKYHQRSGKFNSVEFNKAHPMATKSYKGKTVKISACSHSSKVDLKGRKSTCKARSFGGGKYCKSCGALAGGKRGKFASCKKEWKTDRDATCTKNGSKENYCVYCKKVYSTAAIAKKAHNYKSTTVKATCWSDGYTAQVCTMCDAIKSGTKKTLPKLNHVADKVYSVESEPTCTQTGVRIIHCKLCDAKVYDYPAIDKNNHRWDSGKVTVNPTATKDGTKIYTCIRCKKTKTETLPATGIATKTETVSDQVEFTSSKYNPTTNKRTLTWNMVEDCDGYILRISKVADFTEKTGLILLEGNDRNTYVTETFPDEVYYARVEAYKVIDGKKTGISRSKTRKLYVKDGKGYYQTLSK